MKIDKNIQPVFTTKPTGQGTGLGLSLSYEIVKANDGEIKADTKENEGPSNFAFAGLPGEQSGSEFVITLPLQIGRSPGNNQVIPG